MKVDGREWLICANEVINNYHAWWIISTGCELVSSPSHILFIIIESFVDYLNRKIILHKASSNHLQFHENFAIILNWRPISASRKLRSFVALARCQRRRWNWCFIPTRQWRPIHEAHMLKQNYGLHKAQPKLFYTDEDKKQCRSRIFLCSSALPPMSTITDFTEKIKESMAEPEIMKNRVASIFA